MCSSEFVKLKDVPETISDADKMAAFEGQVIGCLKNNFIKASAGKDEDNHFTKSCQHHVEQLMAEEAKDVELDPELIKFCGRKKNPTAPLNTICKKMVLLRQKGIVSYLEGVDYNTSQVGAYNTHHSLI